MPFSENFPIEIIQGATFILPVEYTDENGVPIDITYYTARMQIRQTYDATETLVDLSTETGEIVVSGPSGRLDITIPDDITAALDAPNSAVYDLFITSLAGKVDRILAGPAEIVPRVTREP